MNSRSFILKCTMCFKIFDYQVKMTESKSSLWNFITTSPVSNKKYAVFCTPNISKAKGLVKVALKKLPKEHRLIVITLQHTEEDLKLAQEQDYGLIAFEELNDFGQQMVGIKNLDLDNEATAKKGSEEVSPNDFIDKVIAKERLF